MIIREEYTCSLELVQDMMKGKRKCSIIWRLRLGPALPSGLRRVYDTFPLKTEYFLTEKGKAVLKALEIYQKIGIDYMIEAG